jgi:hypothetical protein
MKLSIDESKLSAEDKKNPTIQLLLEINRQQAEFIRQLKDEINRLKKHPRKPKIKPSNLEKKEKTGSKKGGKRAGSEKKSKTAEIEIHHVEKIEPDYIPSDSIFIGYRDFVVQDIKIEPSNTRYRLKVYETPDGEYIYGKLPENLNGKHFGPSLIRFVLYQYYHCHVTQPLLLEQLHEIGIDISSGYLNSLLIEGKETFHQEKEDILSVGCKVSSYINVDDTGARHKGKNGYCTYIGNEVFSWFESTERKNRINFLKCLRAGHSDFYLNIDALTYMEVNKLPQKQLQSLIDHFGDMYPSEQDWGTFLTANGIAKPRHRKIATEGALIGSIVYHGISDKLVIVSDDAGQFNVLCHALCWVHAERLIAKIVVFSDQAQKDLESVKDQIWDLYNDLKKYKCNPNVEDKQRLEETFDEIFTSKTDSETLNEALKRIYKNKAELLLVLERPDIPLHNNSAENAIREYVKKRKISGGTRSELGRLARDTFTSLKKTCRKLGLSFWQYLKDRIENIGFYPTLSSLIKEQALKATGNDKPVKLPIDFGSSVSAGYRDIPKYVPTDETNHMGRETSRMVNSFPLQSLKPG